MSTPDLIVRSNRVVQPKTIGPAAIHIHNGVISEIASAEEALPQCPVYDAGELVVMPGLVDTHVHINEPGRTEWEGFETATRAAAAGGVTTLIEMPLNSIPATTTVAAYRKKLTAAEGKLWVDTGFWGGVVPGNRNELAPLYEAGVFGFKCFLVSSGVDEFEHVTEADLREALPKLVAAGAVLLAHAELPGSIRAAAEGARREPPTKYETWLGSRPRVAENEAIAMLIRLAREFGARIHIVHLSSFDAIPLIREAKSKGLAITVETCPHYLTFAAEEIPDGATEFKCAPPIRVRENREKLWAALGEGVIDLIATDHSPCTPYMKCRETGDFLQAWGGIASLELSLPAVWTEALQRGYSVRHLAEWLCRAPARLAGLDARKGAIAVGFDADLVVWDPETSFRVEAGQLRQRLKLTPYAGRELKGVVKMTFLRGQQIYETGEFSGAPAGRVLKREQR
jgi:allantoinase